MHLRHVPAALHADPGVHEWPQRGPGRRDEPARVLPLLQLGGVPHDCLEVADDNPPPGLARPDGTAGTDDDQRQHDLIQPDDADGDGCGGRRIPPYSAALAGERAAPR